MATLSKLFSTLIILLVILMLQLMIRIRKLKSNTNPNPNPINTPRFLKFIEDKHPTICYTKRLKLDRLECSVCLSEFKEGEKVRKLKCKHTFHKDCLDKWLQEYWATCPLCRKKLLPDDVVSKHRQHIQTNNQVGHVDENDDEQLPFLLHVLRGDNTLSFYRFH
ncbi:hypothetical protein RIF29_08692 [Crotalaria pallida]|uniref:RING-type domain-containing protein n=1 Tax=Crotalaria pallida TaxID=3830 RepID=A0AAN9FU22_CROPI